MVGIGIQSNGLDDESEEMPVVSQCDDDLLESLFDSELCVRVGMGGVGGGQTTESSSQRIQRNIGGEMIRATGPSAPSSSSGCGPCSVVWTSSMFY